MVIAVDGACPSNGTRQANKSACGVYFAPGADNWSWRVADRPGERHTSSRAEIHAAIGALKAILPFTEHGGQTVCKHPGGPRLAYHGGHLVRRVGSITQHVDKWRVNGWKTSKRMPVRDRDLWEEMLALLDMIESESETRVEFWHVPREENVEADELANEGLLSRRVLDQSAFDLCDFMQSEEKL
ncbi:hypothetical protein VMCG_02109 [Cytospora schulzeri]|uniref:ribonuclease H n=1 Tax=Cytospora schulzeri TaxID=448051 RepID=A0A423X2U0_9PEZI|nr:hypothetical protein VMCG_02109 [Valsa malicola]